MTYAARNTNVVLYDDKEAKLLRETLELAWEKLRRDIDAAAPLDPTKRTMQLSEAEWNRHLRARTGMMHLLTLFGS